MRAAARIFAVGILPLLGAAGWAERTTAPATEPAIHEYVSAQYRIRLMYPESWTVAGQMAPGEAFSARAGNEKDGFCTISLRVDAGPDSASDEEILGDVSDALAGYAFKNGAEHVVIKPARIAELPARRITFQNSNPNETIRALYVVAVKRRVEYVWGFKGAATEFDSLLPAIEQMLKSFEIAG